MRRFWLVAAVLVAWSLFAGVARAQDTFQVFGGYSYVRQSLAVNEGILCPQPTCPTQTDTLHPSLNGFDVSVAYNPYRWIGAVADFGGNYGSVQGATTHFNTYLFGPQVRFPGPVSPFAHVLLGGAHETIGSGGGTNSTVLIPGSSSAFAVAVGAGIDVKVAPFVSFRPIQIDYLVTRFGSSTQNQPRASAGIVLHF
ncbi:MAG TPA: hypothetical protein VMH00_09485 [Candidatus Limnocylindrales bacterium]|nr:hypothetical protein [Candidatus Limnocylindrales bacterium]